MCSGQRFFGRAPFPGAPAIGLPLSPKRFPDADSLFAARAAGHSPGNIVADVSLDRWRIGGDLPDSNDFKLSDIELLETGEITPQFLEKTVAARNWLRCEAS